MNFAVFPPAKRATSVLFSVDQFNGTIETQAAIQMKAAGIASKIGEDVAIVGEQRDLLVLKIGKAGHRRAGVRAHLRPHAAVTPFSIPLAADVGAALENDGVESLVLQE